MKAPSSQTPLVVEKKTLPPGLYVVATPIGNLGDITLRALQVLHSVAVIACEDTRVTGKLLHHFGIDVPMESYHDHNAAAKRPALLETMAQRPVALVSDAGTPLISDPGYKLVREAVERGLHVEALPGASSVMTALAIAGLPTDRFCFVGFLPAGESAARGVLEEFKTLRATLVFFESARRVAETLALMNAVYGQREACVARELTKLHEEAVRATLPELAAHYERTGEPRGEVVIVLGPPVIEPVGDAELDEALYRLMAEMSLKDAVAEAVKLLDVPRSRAYERALAIKNQHAR